MTVFHFFNCAILTPSITPLPLFPRSLSGRFLYAEAVPEIIKDCLACALTCVEGCLNKLIPGRDQRTVFSTSNQALDPHNNPRTRNNTLEFVYFFGIKQGNNGSRPKLQAVLLSAYIIKKLHFGSYSRVIDSLQEGIKLEEVSGE
ncbi:hypothetical protein K7X08_001868 [Anisodus acutangulus]|uniref:Uncharacterized protein n=1 Tax=Anisodus acutangulus TaxID=402998 RepID=A0A9Q1LNC8_9SOLA|nr:hypothetical protein K7X08_001868 [Anisodus acutangulus]